jgi:hypothetical protein
MFREIAVICSLAQAGYRIAPVQRDRQPEVLTGARVNAGQHRFLHGAVSTPPPDKASREPTPRAPGHGGRKPRELTSGRAWSVVRLMYRSNPAQPRQLGFARSTVFRGTATVLDTPCPAKTVPHDQGDVHSGERAAQGLAKTTGREVGSSFCSRSHVGSPGTSA